MARPSRSTQKIILRNMQAPGDIMMMTAAVRDLHRCYPGKFITGVETTAPDVWKHNPYVQSLDRRHASVQKLGYPLIHKSNQCSLHFIQGFIDDLNRKMNLKVRLTEFRPDLHWSTEELKKPIVEGPYWLIISGGKADFTTKWWDPARYQQIIDRLIGKVAFVQMGNKPEGGGARHHHPPLSNVVNLVGKTKFRQALRLVLHARGIITPVTCFMHAAAAIGKPAIVVAGGREHWTWEAYNEDTLRRNMAYAAGYFQLNGKKPDNTAAWKQWYPAGDPKFVDHVWAPHRFIHTVGQMKCCQDGGCWKIKVTEGRAEQNCVDVVHRPGRPPLPRCLDRISVDEVVQYVLEYEKQIQGAQDMPMVTDLVVKLDGADTPPPPQDPHPANKPPARKMSKKERKRAAREQADPGKPLKEKHLQFHHLKFPITVCGLTWGDHSDLALRSLRSIYANFDPALFKLRYAMNEPSKQARKQIKAFLEAQPNVERLYEATPQVYKYPMMRRMFHDPELPIETDWIMWFDDDSHVVDRDWISRLGQAVDEHRMTKDEKGPNGYHMFGKVYYWHLRDKQWEWIKKATWHTGRKHARDMSKNPPMDKSDFCTGGFWLVTREAIMALNWPDPRIKHRGGDIMAGIAMWQSGFGVKQCYKGVKLSDAKQRGYNEDIVGRR